MVLFFLGCVIITLIRHLIFASENDVVKYSLYEVTAYNNRERAFLYWLYVNSDKYIFMNGVTNEAAIPIDVIVDECCLKEFEKELIINNIDFAYINSDILKEKTKRMRQNTPFTLEPKTIAIKSFYSLVKMQLWIEHKLKKHSILTKIVIGSTYEDRDIIVLKISSGRSNCAILIVGGEEGRDWMSPAIIMNFINSILETQNNVNKLIEYCDFYFLPVFNPDGYTYSLREDIFWSKNRKSFFPKKRCNGRVAIGVNIDRNWFTYPPSNLQDDECKAVYAGEKPLTEEEPQALFQFVNSIANHLMMYINIRGFERLITVPYGHTTMYSNNHLILMEILSATSEKLYRKHNATYFYGNTANILYNFSGNSADWIKEKLNIPVVLTVYMQYMDFVFPDETHIQPLTDQFTTIITETLPVVDNIYGPLFNNAASSFDINRFLLIAIFAVLC